MRPQNVTHCIVASTHYSKAAKKTRPNIVCYNTGTTPLGIICCVPSCNSSNVKHFLQQQRLHNLHSHESRQK